MYPKQLPAAKWSGLFSRTKLFYTAFPYLSRENWPETPKKIGESFQNPPILFSNPPNYLSFFLQKRRANAPAVQNQFPMVSILIPLLYKKQALQNQEIKGLISPIAFLGRGAGGNLSINNADLDALYAISQ